VGFVGMIRDHDSGRHVVRMEYSAHPLAAAVLAEVVAEVAAQSPGHGPSPLVVPSAFCRSARRP
jgi:molybdopterin synthase catalytic subunit